LHRYDSIWRAHLHDRWARIQLGRINRVDTQAWVQELIDEDDELAPATVRKIVYVAASCFQAAVDADLVDRNPFRRVRLPELDDAEARFLLPEEALAVEEHMLQAHYDDERKRTWWQLTVPFTMDTGLRLGELFGVRVRDLDLLRGVVNVRQIVTIPGGRISMGPPKTRAGIRTVPTLTDEVIERLSRHVYDRKLGPDDPVFQSIRCSITDPHNWRARVWASAVEGAKLDDPQPTPHSMRHGAVALWIASGVTDPYKLARWLGHRSPLTVHLLYGHLLPEDAKPTTDALQERRQQARRELLSRQDPVDLGKLRKASADR
jgi:integrase